MRMNFKQGLACLNVPLITLLLGGKLILKANTLISFNSLGIYSTTPIALEAIFKEEFAQVFDKAFDSSKGLTSVNESQSPLLA